MGPNNEVLIFVPQKVQDDQAEDNSRDQVVKALETVYGPKDASKPDFNAATPSSLASVLTAKDPLNLSVNAGDKYQDLARRILAYRDGPGWWCTDQSGRSVQGRWRNAGSEFFIEE